MDAFAPPLTVRRTDFQFKNVGAAVVRRGTIKRDKSRHIDRQALFDVGRRERAALDSDLPCTGGVESLIADSAAANEERLSLLCRDIAVTRQGSNLRQDLR
jgi:hypothetical protein